MNEISLGDLVKINQSPKHHPIWSGEQGRVCRIQPKEGKVFYFVEIRHRDRVVYFEGDELELVEKWRPRKKREKS